MRHRFIVALLVLASLTSFAQPVSCDLSLSDNHLETAMGGELNANLINTGQIIRVKVLIGNFISGVTAPGGHFQLKIGLGNGLVLNPGFNIATASLSDKFSWRYDLSGSQPQIIGSSIADLPDNFAGYADFELKASNSTTSTVSFNLLISNPPGTTTPLSDPNSQNNSGSNTYTVVAGAPLPVTFSSLNAIRNGCEVNVSWRVENQQNLKSYEVEVSKDNASFTKLTEVTAKNASEYLYAFALTNTLKASLLYVRLKSVDFDGGFRYSKTVTVAGTCASKMQIAVFPNPVADVSSLTVVANEGIFDGTYKVSILSSNGQLVQQKELKLSATKSFPLYIAGISAGKYHINIVSPDETSPTVLNFEKL